MLAHSCLPVSAAPQAWKWTTSFPSCVETKGSASNRLASQVDEYLTARHTVAEVLDHFGPPEGYSAQAMYSLHKGAGLPPDGPISNFGTLRFILEDGGEFHLEFCNCVDVCQVIRYSTNGKGHLLWK